MIFLKYLQNEFRKYLDIKYFGLLLSGPILIVILTLIQTIQTGAGSFTEGGSNGFYVIQQNLSLWGLLMFTPFIATITIYLAYTEHSNNIWKLLFTLRANREQILLAKVVFLSISIASIYLVFFSAISLEVLLLDVFIEGFTFDASDLTHLFTRLSIMLMLSFAISLFHFALALWFKTPILPFILAIVITIINFLVVSSSLNFLFPWSIVTLFAQIQMDIEAWQVILSPVMISLLSIFVILKLFTRKDL